MEYLGEILAGLGALLVGVAKLIKALKSDKDKRDK